MIFVKFKIFLNIKFLYSINFGIELLDWRRFSVFSVFVLFLAVEGLLTVIGALSQLFDVNTFGLLYFV